MTKSSTLAVCQLFNPLLHGNSSNAMGHFLALHTYDDEFDDSPYGFLNSWTPKGFDEKNDMNDFIERSCGVMRTRLINNSQSNNCESFGNNIANIRELNKLPKVDIVKTIELDSGHLVAIKKTVWLAIFQRMLKKRYSNVKLHASKKQRVL
jgi:hypothetical protein